MREDRERARKREVRPEARPLVARQRVEECARRRERGERQREEPAEAAFLVLVVRAVVRTATAAGGGDAARVVVRARGVLGVEHLFDRGGGRAACERARAEEVAYCFGVCVDDAHAALEVARVALHEYGVLVEVEILEGRCEVGFQGGVVASLRVQDETVDNSAYAQIPNRNNVPAAHDIGRPAEHLGQTADQDVSVGQHLHVDEIANSLIDDNQEVVFVR